MSNSRLEQVGVASPCNVSWDSMQGDGAVRFCGQCDLNVYNLSAMTQDEAQGLLDARSEGGRLCVRYYRRKDGTILTQNCPVGLARLRQKFGVLRATVAAGLSVLLGGFMTGCEPSEASVQQPAPQSRRLPTVQAPATPAASTTPAPATPASSNTPAPAQPVEPTSSPAPDASNPPAPQIEEWEMGDMVCVDPTEEPTDQDLQPAEPAPAERDPVPEDHGWMQGGMEAPEAE